MDDRALVNKYGDILKNNMSNLLFKNEKRIMFQKLRDDYLIEAYEKAYLLNLDHYFINLIEKESTTRGYLPFEHYVLIQFPKHCR